MSHKRVFVFVAIIASIFMGLAAAFSQDQVADTQVQPAAPETAAVSTEQSSTPSTVAAVTNPEFQWVWGEVSSVDAAKSEFVIKYLDYETDQEKEMTIGVDNKTSYENTKSFSDIKPKDTLSIDYIVSADNKNIAKNISVEEVEVAPETQKWTDVPQAQSEPAATPMNQ